MTEPSPPTSKDEPAEPDPWARADGILDQALDLPKEERSAFLANACRDDGDLRALVERLLAAAESDTALDPIGEALALTWAEADGLAAGSRVGRYRVLKEIGRGGMAVVYLAERDDGEFEHRVALKVIQGGLQGEEGIRRFQRERQILARLRHPAIAQLFDGGTTEDGRPFFVLEHVQGRPIDAYCEEEGLTIRQRLALFVRAARAVQSAHGNLVVHRDIKPSNLLVTTAGEPKLLDFGIAGLLADEGSPTLTQTRTAAMTPAYASPEQLRGEPLTTASDVYQLGVLLFQILTGTWPYGPTDGSMTAIERAVRRNEPERPSAALPARSEDAPLRRRLRGDLDNIVLKALRKKPEERYRSVGELILDLERHLDGRPVSARPATFAYRAATFLQRHAAAAAIATVAILLLAGSTAFYITRLADERDHARQSAEEARKVSDFLTGIFEDAAPVRGRGEQVTARELLDRGSRWIDRDLADQPQLRAEMLTRLGSVYRELALFDEAEAHLKEAVALRNVGDPVERSETLSALGELRLMTANYPRAEGHFSEALALRREAGGLGGSPDTAAALDGLGRALTGRGAFDEARQALEEALEIRRRHLGDGHPAVGRTLHHLGRLALESHRYEDALLLLEDAWQVLAKSLDSTHPRAIGARADLANVLATVGQWAAAREHYEAVLPELNFIWGEVHPESALHLSRYASLLADEQQIEESLALHRQALDRLRRTLGSQHPEVAEALIRSARAHRGSADAKSERLALAESITILDAAFGPDYPRTAIALLNLARLEERENRPRQALEHLERVLTIREATFEKKDRSFLFPLAMAGRLHADLGEAAQAEPYLRRALEIGRVMDVEGVHAVALPQISLAWCLIDLGQNREARELIEELHWLPADADPAVRRRFEETKARLAQISD